ncbi:peptidoglycan hydrolase CwlO-like protein [Streptacidiphilus sp. MAP12-16]|uniref:hypothetical protein n=1 Tax=Streptacidiphilus sp. MAP12-16 TaxID=3156300 RepID=UPI003515F888
MAGTQTPDSADGDSNSEDGTAGPRLPGRPANRLDPADFTPAVYTWLAHLQELTERVFTTRAAAAKALAVHPTTLSKRLNGHDLCDREFVTRFLDACERAGHPPSPQVRQHTTDLHLAALAASTKAADRAAHRGYLQADALQAAHLRQAQLEAQVEGLQDRAQQAEAQMRQAHAQIHALQDTHTHQHEDLVRERDTAVHERVQAEHHLADTQQHAQAIRQELHDTREQLRQSRLEVAALTEELLATRGQLESLRTEQQRRRDDDAVVAEALAVTERALSQSHEAARQALVPSAATTPTTPAPAQTAPSAPPPPSDWVPLSRSMFNLVHELETMNGPVGFWRARRRLRAVAREWTPEEINGLVQHMNLMHWYSRDARRVMRYTRVRVHPLLEPPSPLRRTWAKLRRTRLQPATFTFHRPPRTTPDTDSESNQWVGIM